MIIVEGPDGAGKTTLVKILSKTLGWRIADRVVDKDTTITGGQGSLKKWVRCNLDQGFQKIIFDRHRLISEPIYGPLFRGGLQDGFDDANWHSGSWGRLMRTKPFVIFCLPPLEIVTRNVMRDPDNKEVSPAIAQIYWAYWTTYCRMPYLPRVRYDYTGQSGGYSVDKIFAMIQEHTYNRRLYATG